MNTCGRWRGLIRQNVLTERLVYEYDALGSSRRSDDRRYFRYLIAPMVSANLETLDATWQYGCRPTIHLESEPVVLRSTVEQLYHCAHRRPKRVYDVARGPVVFPASLGALTKWSSAVSANAEVDSAAPFPFCGPQLAELESLEVRLTLAVHPLCLAEEFKTHREIPMCVGILSKILTAIKDYVYRVKVEEIPVMLDTGVMSGVTWSRVTLCLHHMRDHFQEPMALSLSLKHINGLFRDERIKSLVSEHRCLATLRAPAFGSRRVMRMKEVPYLAGVVKKSRDYSYIASIMEPEVVTREKKESLRCQCVALAYDAVHKAYTELRNDSQDAFWQSLPHHQSQLGLATNLQQALMQRSKVTHKTLAFMYLDHLEKNINAYIKNYVYRGLRPMISQKVVVDNQLPAILCAFHAHETGQMPPLYEEIKTKKKRENLQAYLMTCRNFLSLLDRLLAQMHKTGERVSFKCFMKKMLVV